MKFVVASLIVLAAALAGCSSVPGHDQRQATATAMASARGWRSELVASSSFALTTWQPKRVTPHDLLTVYVEGDGLAWLSPTQPSTDPTPINPVALKLALAQSVGNAVYVARPCQYDGIADERCRQQYWTGQRFAEDVVAATGDVVDRLKQRFGAKKLILVGYSGGAAVTALLAQRRSDVAAWITVAGNIDHRSWTRQHHMTPLTGSLDPMEDAQRLSSLPQWHYVGEQDHIVPAEPTARFVAAMQAAKLIRVDGYDHGCCWENTWASNYDKMLAELTAR